MAKKIKGHSHMYKCISIIDMDVCAIYEFKCEKCTKKVYKKYPRTYSGYAMFQEEPSREEYLKRLKEEGLEEPKDDD